MADILIRGMKMPKDQPVLVFIWPDGRVFPNGLYKSEEWDGVKAVPLPEGHGKIIDADMLMEIIRAHDYPLTAHFNSTDNGMFTLGIQQAVDEAYKMFHSEPMDEHCHQKVEEGEIK